MTLDEFWSVIRSSGTKGGGDDQKQREALLKELAGREEVEIIEFAKLFHALMVRAYRWELSSAVFLIEGGLGDDGFHDLRDYLVSRGRDVYERVLRDPESLLDEPLDHGELHYFSTAAEAYRLRRGVPKDDDVELPVDLSWPEHPAGERVDYDDEDAIRKRFPRIWEHIHSRR